VQDAPAKKEAPQLGIFASLVHKSVRDDELVAAKHHAFIVSHIVAPALACVAVPVHWYLNGGFDPLVVQSLCWLMSPALVAAYLVRSGELATSYFLSSAILATLVGLIAAHTGGVGSFAAFWLLAVPVEAAMSGSRKVVVASVALCAAVLALLAASSSFHLLPLSRVDPSDAQLYGVIGLVSALLYIGMLSGTIEHLNGKSDQAVQDNARRFRLMAENATDVITRHGPNGDVSFISGAANKLVSCDPEKLGGRGYMNLVHPEDRHVFLTAFIRAADTREPASAEFRLANDFPAAGTVPQYKWVELNCRPIREADSESGLCEIVAISRDVTARRQRQEELRFARDSAEEASRAKTAFLANMSHELRTPLNSVIGFAELLERDPATTGKPAASAEYAKLIRQSGEHLLAVVNDLLDLSKIEAGQFTLCPEVIDLNEVATYCEHVMQTAADDADVAIALDLADGGVDVDADPRACKQILLNLLSNAIKFSEPGSTVRLRTAGDGSVAHLVVQDHGSGIAPELLSKLGQPFVQADDEYSRRHEGAGLGLCIVNGLVKLHGGSIAVDSLEKQGTTITVSLPLAERAQEADLGLDQPQASESRTLEPTA
jgi:cell cycle sensor histidine kinase DivJ